MEFFSAENMKKLHEIMQINDIELPSDAVAFCVDEVYKRLDKFEWCKDCKEYDHDKNCCHRWTKVIRETLDEIERKKGKWIYDTERIWRNGGIYAQNHCSECNYQIIGSLYNFCPNCGADMRGEQ